MPMNDDYGPKLGKALQAVHQMHVDVTKLMLMLDKELGRKSILVRITEQAKFSVNGGIWMPEGMHRIYAVPEIPGRVEGITTVFLDLHGEPVTEPLLLVGQAQFDCPIAKDLKSTLAENENVWCLWTGYLGWQEEHEYGKVVRIDAPPTDDEADKKLRWVQVIAVPLYAISSVTDVMKLLQQARATASRAKAAMPV
jgi:hypothetical protein